MKKQLIKCCVKLAPLSLLSQLVKTSRLLNRYRPPLTTATPPHASIDSEVVCKQTNGSSEETVESPTSDIPTPESSEPSVKVIPVSCSSSSSPAYQNANENKENIKETLSIPSVTLTRIDSSKASSLCDTTSHADEPLPRCQFHQLFYEQLLHTQVPNMQKRHWWLDCLFCAFGICASKSW